MPDAFSQNNLNPEEDLQTFQNPSSTLPKEIEQKIINLISINNKIAAIKELRQYTGMTLIEAKSCIDTMAAGQPRNLSNSQNEMSATKLWSVVLFICLFFALMTGAVLSQVFPQLVYFSIPLVCPNGKFATQSYHDTYHGTSVDFQCITNKIVEDKTFSYILISIIIYTVIYFMIIFCWSWRNKLKGL